jgi:hypothetical protein
MKNSINASPLAPQGYTLTRNQNEKRIELNRLKSSIIVRQDTEEIEFRRNENLPLKLFKILRKFYKNLLLSGLILLFCFIYYCFLFVKVINNYSFF